MSLMNYRFCLLVCLLVCLFVDLFFGMSVGMSVGLSVGWSVNWSNGFFVGLGTSVPRLGEVPRYHVCKRGTKRGTKVLFFIFCLSKQLIYQFSQWLLCWPWYLGTSPRRGTEVPCL